ncbi:MAG: hypothetical protein ACO3CD_06125 [Candidatus Nanopelagicaceae bacterium]
MIKLNNPKTETYLRLKDHILSENFPWFQYNETLEPGSDLGEYDDVPFLSHGFLIRPGIGGNYYSRPNSQNLDQLQEVFREICFVNGIDPQIVYRMNANYTVPTEKNLPSPPHVDHDYPHKNMLIYLTPTNGGHTIVNGEEIFAEEDDVVIFDGSLKHCARPPLRGKRIVLIVTYYDF